MNPLPANFAAVTHICCIGARRESVANMAVLTQYYPNKTVTIVDFDQAKLQFWAGVNVDWVEPGLGALAGGLNNLELRDQVEEVIDESQIIFIWVEIPTKRGGLPGLDTTEWERAVRTIVQASATSKIVVEKSTMPVDMFNLTTRFLSQRPQAQVQQNIQFAVFSNPELSCPGQMLNDMQFPDQVIIARKSDVGDTDILVEMYAQWVPAQRIIVLPNHLSAELVKIITSVMAGLKITVMNVIASYCEKVGANFNHVKQMLGRDYRFEDAFMESTLGIGGPDLLKDIVYCKDALQNVGLVIAKFKAIDFPYSPANMSIVI